MSDQEAKYTKADLVRIGERWIDKIHQSEKREEDWTKQAESAEAAYTVDTGDGVSTAGVPDFNILHSNVETIVPSIFNSTPIPEIRPRHNRDDDGGTSKGISDLFERAIATLIDDARLDAEVEFQAQDAFMAGRGVLRIKFDADEQEQDPVLDPETDEEVAQAPLMTNERIIYENVSWRDYREGPAKRWSGVPWVAYRHEISARERERLEDPKIKAAYAKDAGTEDVDEDRDCTVWEIWCKETRRVYFVIDESSKVIEIVDDPLEISGFFPQAQPIQPITPTGKRLPVCPYAVYKVLAEELDTTTKRINKITKGMKLRGAAAIGAGAIEEMMAAGDNEIAVLADIEGLGAMGGLERAITWWPIEKAVAVLVQLYTQREQTKQAIYEITGISDIIRGQGAVQETATAQQIKTEWGALRIKKMQRMIERQVRDIFVISAEVISQHFSPQTLQEMTGIQITTEMQELLGKPLNHYRIDVESNSTVRANQTRNRQEMGDFLRGTAEFFGTMAPIVQQAPQAAGPLAKMYSAFAGQFNLGKSAEDALEQFVVMAEQAAEQAAQQPEKNPEAEMKQHEMQAKVQEMQGKFELEVEKLKLQAQGLGLDNDIKKAELSLKERELDHKGNELTLKEREAEFGAIKAVKEIEIEVEQERPALVGE